MSVNENGSTKIYVSVCFKMDYSCSQHSARLGRHFLSFYERSHNTIFTAVYIAHVLLRFAVQNRSLQLGSTTYVFYGNLSVATGSRNCLLLATFQSRKAVHARPARLRAGS
jgi:hypothetical protein